MITLLILLAVFATTAVTINVGLLGFVVFLLRKRKQALKAIDALNGAVYSLSVDKAYLLAQQKPNLLWYDKGSETVH